MEVKSWLAQIGCKVKENRFLKPPPFPYIVFHVAEEQRGDDNGIGILEQDITIELYSEEMNCGTEEKIQSLLRELKTKYEKRRTWIESETMFQTVYTFHVVEKTEV